MTEFENISQRVASSYRRQLTPFVPIIPEPLSAPERQAVQDSQRELHAFFEAFYACVHDDPAAFGLPVAEDACVNEGDGKDEKRAVARHVQKARVKITYGIDFLRLLGRHGALVDNALRLGAEDYAVYLAKSPRVKRKFLKGMAVVGFVMSELDDAVMVRNSRYPAMMPALKSLAEACARFDNERLAGFLFARCDLQVLDAGYQPDALDLLRPMMSPAEYEQATVLHQVLAEMSYVPSLSVGGVHDWRIQYQGKRAVKSTPFFEFEYDERRKHQLGMHVKCAAANRLVPLLAEQPAALQEDFFRHAYRCSGAECGWCKTRKGLGPSALAYAGETRTICWYMRRRFATVTDEAVKLVKQYAQLHEVLATA